MAPRINEIAHLIEAFEGRTGFVHNEVCTTLYAAALRYCMSHILPIICMFDHDVHIQNLTFC